MGPACLLLVLALGTGARGPVSLTHYTRAVDSIRVSLDRALKLPSGSTVSRIQAQLRSLRDVRLPDGTVVHTDLPVLAGQLAPSDASSVGRAAATIDALDSALHAAPRRAVDRATLRSLDTVLEDARFHPARPPWAPITDRIAELRRRLIEWLASLLQHSGGSAGAFAIFLLLLVAGLGYLLARGALGRLVVDAAQEEDERAPSTSVTAEQRAQGSAAAGDYRKALRYLFLATMLALQERGALELRPGLTNRDYLRIVRAHRPEKEELRKDLDELVDIFDETWYGHLPFGETGFERCRQLSSQIVRAATRRAA